MRPLPMMHWTSQYNTAPSPGTAAAPFWTSKIGPLSPSPPLVVTSLESGLNLFPWGPSLLLTSGGYWTTYGWKTGGTHPIGMLSCLFTNLIILPFVTLHHMSPPNIVRIIVKHTEANFCDESNVNTNKFLMALISSVIYFRLLFTIKLKQEPKKQPQTSGKNGRITRNLHVCTIHSVIKTSRWKGFLGVFFCIQNTFQSVLQEVTRVKN